MNGNDKDFVQTFKLDDHRQANCYCTENDTEIVFTSYSTPVARWVKRSKRLYILDQFISVSTEKHIRWFKHYIHHRYCKPHFTVVRTWTDTDFQIL